MRPACCICYTADPAYLLPALVSAIQARWHAPVQKADVIIYSFGADAAAEAVFARICGAENIGFVPISQEKIDGANAMLARLFLPRFVDTDYSQFLYLDGDTQITGALDPLLDYAVPRGQFLAATDPMTFAAPGNDKQGREFAAHFSSLGIPPQDYDRYFNTGVLRINRDGWEEIGLAAWALFQNQLAKARFPDQDALNVAGMSRRIPMSLGWNFPIFMRNARVAQQIRPRILHFMSSPKPWHGVFMPWGPEAHQPYPAILHKYPILAEYISRIPVHQKLRYYLQQQFKYGVESFSWGSGSRRRRILSYEDGLDSASGPAGIAPGVHPA
jgi:lipopolysaccharide biosynthesis glycosyltransferase